MIQKNLVDIFRGGPRIFGGGRIGGRRADRGWVGGCRPIIQPSLRENYNKIKRIGLRGGGGGGYVDPSLISDQFCFA